MADDELREDVHKADDPTGAAGSDVAAPDDETAAALVAKFPGSVFHRSHGQPVVYVDRASLADVAGFLKEEQEFTMCLDVTVVDHLLDELRLEVPGVVPERFEVVVSFLSHPRNRRIRVICEVPAEDPEAPSVTGHYPGADFAEREAYDMFGVRFDGHPDLVRILMPDDWVGYPLRKDDAPARVPVTFKEDPGPR